MTMGNQLVCSSRWSTCIAQRVPGIKRMDSMKLGTMLCVCHAPRDRCMLVGVYAQMVRSTSCRSLEGRHSSS